MPSAAESGVEALFHNAKSGEPSRFALEEMGHTKQATNMQADNSTSERI